MQNGERLNLEQIRAFLEASEEIEFEAANRREVYDWATRALCEQEYWKQGRAQFSAKRFLTGQPDENRAALS